MSRRESAPRSVLHKRGWWSFCAAWLVTGAGMADHTRMVGLRWVGCWALLAVSCGRTANSGGAPNALGGTGSAGALSGEGAVSTAAGAAGAPLCPVTPAAGQWFARGPDAYAFELGSDGSQLSGRGCLGALPFEGDSFRRRALNRAPAKARRPRSSARAARATKATWRQGACFYFIAGRLPSELRLALMAAEAVMLMVTSPETVRLQ